MVIVMVWVMERSLSTPLLLVLGSNMLLYLAYYLARKVVEVLVRRSRREEKTRADNSKPESWVCWITHVLHLRSCEEQDTEEEEQEVSAPPSLATILVRWLSFLLFGAALVLAVVAAAFYAAKHQSRNLSPAESREKNQECRFLQFYDNHDMWHFFSSLALFLALLGLLTIDDDLLYVPMDTIKVF